MRRTPGFVGILAGVFVSGAVLFGPVDALAGAQVRYASPGGDPSAACTQATPCDLRTAVESAPRAGEVRLLGGAYNVGATPLSIRDERRVLADDPADPVTISENLGAEYPGGAVFVQDDATLSDVTVTSDHSFGTLGAFGRGALERVVAVNTGSGPACSALFMTLRDSLCLAEAGAAVDSGDVSGFAIAKLRNVTAVSNQGAAISAEVSQADGSSSAGEYTLDARNSILLGDAETALSNQPSGPDVSVTARDPDVSVDAVIDFSNFDEAETISGGAASFSVSAPGSASNQLGLPAFADAAADDFHQAAASPTIDAGDANASDLGARDLDGEARVQGEGIDIGAYETERDETSPALSIRRGPPKTTRKRTAEFVFTASDDSTPGLPDLACALDAKPAAPCSSPKTYRNLKPGRHSFRVTATDDAGNSATKRYAWKVLGKKRRG